MLCPSIFEGPNSTLVQVFSLPYFLGKIAHPVLWKENENLHNSTEKNKENMKS